MSSLGETIKRARKLKELSLRDLAEMTGFSPIYISMVENDKCTPSAGFLEDIGNVLDIDTRWLEESAKRVPSNVIEAMANRRILVDIVYKLMEKSDDDLRFFYQRL